MRVRAFPLLVARLLFAVAVLAIGSALLLGGYLLLGPSLAPRPASPTPWPVTATWTPFVPLSPTPTYLPTSTPTPTPTATPTPTPVPTPTPMGYIGHAVPPLPQAQGRINILLLGSDRRPQHADFRTDAFMLLSYNPKTGATSIISFPRDTFVYLPGVGYNRINTAMEFGGFPLVQRTLEYNFGIRPSHYILVEFRGFATLIDQLGGVDVVVPHQLCDRRTHYGDHYCVGPGTVHMDGSLALWYARSRITTSDFDRAHRQQSLILAMIRKLLSLNALGRAPALYQTYRQSVTTDISLAAFLKMVGQARRFRGDAIRTYVIQPPALQPWITPQGAYVLLPRHNAVRSILESALSR